MPWACVIYEKREVIEALDHFGELDCAPPSLIDGSLHGPLFRGLDVSSVEILEVIKYNQIQHPNHGKPFRRHKTSQLLARRGATPSHAKN